MTSNQTFMVTPDTEVAQDVSTSAVDNTGRRTFTIANPVADAEHQLAVIDAGDVSIDADGQVTLDATSGAADLTASSAYIELIGGAAAGQLQSTTVTPTTGDAVNVVIDSVTPGESVVLIVWFDADEDGNLDVDADGAPTEPFGVSGVTDYIHAGLAADTDTVTVTDVNFNLGYFVGDDAPAPGNNDDGLATFFYDATDSIRFQGGANVSVAVFEGMLTAGDVIDVIYDADGPSVFNVATDVVPDVSDVEAEVVAIDATTNNVELTWTASAQADATYTIERDTVVIATGVTGTSYTDEDVATNADWTYTVQAVGGVSEALSATKVAAPDVKVPADPETLAVLANGSVVDTNVGSTATATSGDVFVMYFDNDVVLTGASLLIDGVIVEDGANATFVADGSVLTITLSADAVGITYADDGTLTAIAGVESVDGELATFAADPAFENDGPELVDSTFSAASNSVVLEFNEALIEVTAENVSNYAYDLDPAANAGAGDPEAVVSATLGADGRTVTLVVTTAPTAATSTPLSVKLS